MWQVIGLGERLFSTLLLLGLSPIWITSALVLAGCSRRAPFIAHRRVGWRGSALWMLKLRTMWDPADVAPRGWGLVEYIDDEDGPKQKREQDPRVQNAFAQFCRRHSIDEIPQLWHVARGEMALIGPRPVTLGEIHRHYGEDADELLRVKPGIAGLWQTSGRNRLTYAERKQLDLQFVRNRSVSMYATIALRTIPEVLGGTNTW
jgi:lipopolysaccharide/colanic/teichoic acid biosynthesis glycosyltransferase